MPFHEPLHDTSYVEQLEARPFFSIMGVLQQSKATVAFNHLPVTGGPVSLEKKVLSLLQNAEMASAP